jgi:hypothetical protein
MKRVLLLILGLVACCPAPQLQQDSVVTFVAVITELHAPNLLTVRPESISHEPVRLYLSAPSPVLEQGRRVYVTGVFTSATEVQASSVLPLNR